MLSDLFEPEPARWGLRGDPHLWRELRAALASQPAPGSAAELAQLLAQTFEQLTGAPLDAQQPIFVARLNHGGMSGGYVDPRFWAETGLPLLIERFRRATGDDQAH